MMNYKNIKTTLPKPLICGVSGVYLTKAEKKIYTRIKPLGFILFKKNLADKSQVSSLCTELREITGRYETPIMIDQEGGSVIRLKSPIWREPPSPLELGKFAYAAIENGILRSARLVNLNAQLIAYEMKEIGINVNCSPVADLLIPDAHHITSVRSLGPNPDITTILVNNMIEGMQKHGVQAVIKHMLGQGRAKSDSHLSLPTVDDELSVLEKNDFAVFKHAQNVKWGMTAHIIYNNIDKDQPVTYSLKTVDYIRNIIGFRGVLISDCLTMRALREEIGVKASKTINAGIDVVLYGGCNPECLTEIAQNIPHMDKERFSKVKNSFEPIQATTRIEYSTILAEYNELFNNMQHDFDLLPKSNFSSDLKFIIKILEERNSPTADHSSPLYKA